MVKVWIIGILLFLITIFLFWKLTAHKMKEEYGEKMWKQWTSRLYYWQAAIYASTGVTIGILFLLRSLNVLTF